MFDATDSLVRAPAVSGMPCSPALVAGVGGGESCNVSWRACTTAATGFHSRCVHVSARCHLSLSASARFQIGVVGLDVSLDALSSNYKNAAEFDKVSAARPNELIPCG